MRRILVSAYDVNPYRGSESGTGWNFVRQLARFAEVVAVTRENNRPHIERYLAEHPEAATRVEFLYFDLPRSLRFWKRGQRGSSLYFYLWQLALPLFVRRRGVRFDVAHNLNFHTDTTPSLLWTLRRPMVWGPIGHHPRIPRQFLKPYGARAYLRDRLVWAAKRALWSCDPLLRLTRRRAAVVLCMNSGVERVVPLDPRRVVRFPSVGTDDVERGAGEDGGDFTVLSAGRFVPLKGFDVTLHAFARACRAATPEERRTMRLVLVGHGPCRPMLERLARDLGVEDRVRIVEWLERAEFVELYRRASVFLFPSHEGAGMVVPEALSAGLPVLCFDNEGPGEMVDESCGARVPYLGYDASAARFAEHLLELLRDPARRRALAVGARRRYETRFSWDAKGDALAEIYRERLPA